ncbi:MerR family transcriptional regulator [Aurantibacter sp.]|uniref:MerR family transcriptional regulator n=1 Tax=Aurantibacter sp. TaxID=2807103 RepID=UPI0035C845D2
MNNIKNKFSIKDLENLSGIKAHTIRIWEKRYNLFNPNRTNTNIRYYSLDSLQKLLNISFLNSNGIKISKIAKLSSIEICDKVREISISSKNNNHIIDVFKLAMLNFDQALFIKTYNELISEYDFKTIFFSYFVPFLNEIGLLWQTNTITPSHEHFIVELIKQRILVNTEKSSKGIESSKSKETYVLFLPDNEIHELGLLFINYEILNKGHHTIYLGQSVPIESMISLMDFYSKITFISCFTIKPEANDIKKYLKEFNKKLLHNTSNELLICGRMTEVIPDSISNKVSTYKFSKEIIDTIESTPIYE